MTHGRLLLALVTPIPVLLAPGRAGALASLALASLAILHRNHGESR